MIEYSEPFLLSRSGSTRATAYNWGNKVITLDGKTHVVWLDAVSVVCGRTFDHASNEWSETFRLFQGCDNHANPSITADAEGRIRIVWGPHGWWAEWNQARIKWAIASEPNSLANWEREENFGYNATGPTIVHAPDGYDIVVCRGGESPAGTVFHRKRQHGGWTSAKVLMHQEIAPQYTHHYGHVACDAGGTIYAACHFYNVGGGDNHPVAGEKSRMRSYGMGVIKTQDAGRTWMDLNGQAVETPATYEDRIAIPPNGENMYVDGIALDSSGRLRALVKNSGVESWDVFLACWDGGGWTTQNLESYLPAECGAVDGVLTIDSQDRIHVLLTSVIKNEVSAHNWWGHPCCEVFHLVSSPGTDSFECRQVSIPDKAKGNWLPNISKSGPFHPVEKPLILYTHGESGQGCTPETQTEVWCRFVES
ncbi:MAG: BNR-4 repeat-containing protein [Planctomycetota bacterium]|nr:BNR-4 repeat-containing protein [Planctomycetota bacterium]MDA1142338.1 BNR-4 repeat-containing protein [Planctomycetota bacterium]